MPALSPREKRTVRFAATAIGIYLALFAGYRAYKHFETRRVEYQDLLVKAQRLKRDLRPFENRVLLADKLKGEFKMDPQKLARATIVADVSSAIQKAAAAGRVQLGHVRESAARASAKELATVHFDGSGPVPAVMTLLHRLESLGYPLVVDALQINAEPTKPGSVKISLTITILDFDQWKKEAPNA